MRKLITPLVRSYLWYLLEFTLVLFLLALIGVGLDTVIYSFKR